ncbi:MAG: aspartate kinase [Candidatus Micrarchaeaceae archaeon]
MIVMKFGGSSVANAERIQNVVNIIRLNIEREPVVVVSALGGVTDSLIKSAELAVEGGETEEIYSIEKKHLAVISSLGISDAGVKKDLQELRMLMKEIAVLGKLTQKTLDRVVSFGERMSSKIIASYMQKTGIAAKAYNAYDIGMLTDSGFGGADIFPRTYGLIAKAMENLIGTVPVITGYIGMDKNGDITTLGRGGSDYTASIIGAALDVEEIQIWTDVDGIMTADPKIVKGAKNITEVSYDEASELALLGAKVLHPKTILPAINKNIPVRILNTFNPGHRGTVVLKDIKKRRRIASITCKKRMTVINIYSTKMSLAREFIGTVFAVIDNLGFSVDIISASDSSVSITIDGDRDTNELVQKLREKASVAVIENRAKISLVGKNMNFTPEQLGKLSSSLSDIRIEMAPSGASDISQSFVVEEKVADKAVIKLHKTFFGR